jgi:hypothetical protein
VAFGRNGECQMAIVVDGVRQCPSRGCNFSVLPDRPGGQGCTSSRSLNSTTAVMLDRFIEANEVAGIEVYDRGGNMPISLQVSDQACGVIAIWTGSRR